MRNPNTLFRASSPRTPRFRACAATAKAVPTSTTSTPRTPPEHSPPHPHPLYTHPCSTPPLLGYPGEGPTKIATYNINGAKDKLFHVLGAAGRARIDVLLLQETHYYALRIHALPRECEWGGCTGMTMGWSAGVRSGLCQQSKG
eukprot:scaffold4672_cov129-Isochrysis_galbana.AAC.7